MLERAQQEAATAVAQAMAKHLTKGRLPGKQLVVPALQACAACTHDMHTCVLLCP